MEADSCNPAGASVSRGGAANGPAAVYAIRKWDEWLRNYAPPGAASYDFYQSLPALSTGNVAQQIFWYTAFTASMVAPKSEGNNTVDDEGNPLWRMAPSPHGAYWDEGQKLGYQDAGSWTRVQVHPRRSPQGGLAVRPVHRLEERVPEEDPRRPHPDPRQRHPARFVHRTGAEAGRSRRVLPLARPVRWSPTGVNVPDYPKLAQIWWQQIGDVNSGAFTPQQAMDRLAGEMDQVMARMQAADERANTYGGCGPRLNPEKDPSEWLSANESPKAKRDEKPQGKTIDYDELVKRWQTN